MYEYKARLLRVVDGDTVDGMIDLGFNVWIKQRIRLYGVDTWECRTRDKAEKKKGLAAKEFTKEMLGDYYYDSEFYNLDLSGTTMTDDEGEIYDRHKLNIIKIIILK